MTAETEELTKSREICFLVQKSDQQQAVKATQLLEGIEGIQDVHVSKGVCITLDYDLSIVTLRIIEEALAEVGFGLQNDLITRLKRLFYYYIEDTQLVNRGYQHDSKSTVEIFVNRYEQLEHGSRDERPEHYHHYN